MELLWKCAALAISASLLGLAIKKQQEEQALLLGAAAAVLIISAALISLKDLEGLLRQTAERSSLSSSLMLPVLKSLGLAVLGRFSSGLCRDSGQATAAAAVELAATCAILCVSVPLLQSLLDAVLASF